MLKVVTLTDAVLVARRGVVIVDVDPGPAATEQAHALALARYANGDVVWKETITDQQPPVSTVETSQQSDELVELIVNSNREPLDDIDQDWMDELVEELDVTPSELQRCRSAFAGRDARHDSRRG